MGNAAILSAQEHAIESGKPVVHLSSDTASPVLPGNGNQWNNIPMSHEVK